MEMIEIVAAAIRETQARPHTDADVARAAIEAMIIPTNGMLGEAAKAMSPGKRPTQDFVSVKEKHKIRYQAMIRKALEE